MEIDKEKSIYLGKVQCESCEATGLYKGAAILPVIELYCPYQWTSQEMQLDGHPQHKFYQANCNKSLSYGLIRNCVKYSEKQQCWKKYNYVLPKILEKTEEEIARSKIPKISNKKEIL